MRRKATGTRRLTSRGRRVARSLVEERYPEVNAALERAQESGAASTRTDRIEAGCSNINSLIQMLQATPDVEVAAQMLNKLGVPEEELQRAYETEGIVGIVKALHKDCAARVNNWSETDIEGKAREISTANAKADAAVFQAASAALEVNPLVLSEAAMQVSDAYAQRALTTLGRIDRDMLKNNTSRAKEHAKNVERKYRESQNLIEQQSRLVQTARTDDEMAKMGQASQVASDLMNEMRKTNDTAALLEQRLRESEENLKRQMEAEQAYSKNWVFRSNEQLQAILAKVFAEDGSALRGMTAAEIASKAKTEAAVEEEVRTMGGFAKADVNIYERDARGRPVLVVKNKHQLGPLAKMVMATAEHLQNVLESEKRCAAVLAKHNISNRDTFDHFIQYLAEEMKARPDGGFEGKDAHREELINEATSCLTHALHVSRASLFQELEKHLDMNGFIKLTTSDGKEIDPKYASFVGMNRYEIKFEELRGKLQEEAKAAFDTWLAGQLRSDSAQDEKRYRKALSTMQKYGVMGTGYQVGPTPLVDAHMTAVLRTFSGASGGARGMSQADAVKMVQGAYDRVPAWRNVASLWEGLSPAARQVLDIRRLSIAKIVGCLHEVSNNSGVDCDLTEQSDLTHPDDVGKFNSQSKLHLQKNSRLFFDRSRDAFATLSKDEHTDAAFKEIRNKLAVVWMGAEGKALGEADPYASDPDAQALRAVWGMVKTMKNIFGITVNCQKLAETPRESKARQSLFNKMIGDIRFNLNTLFGRESKSACIPSASVFDQLVSEGIGAADRDQVRGFAPMRLMDQVLIAMGLPCASELLGRSDGNHTRERVLYDLAGPLRDVEEACRRAREHLSTVLGYSLQDTDEGRRNWCRFVAKCVTMANVQSTIEISFLSSTEFTHDELWKIFREQPQCVVSAKVLGGGFGNRPFSVAVAGAVRGAKDGAEAARKRAEEVAAYKRTIDGWIDNLKAQAPHTLSADLLAHVLPLGPHQGEGYAEIKSGLMGKPASGIPLVLHDNVIRALQVHLGGLLPHHYELPNARHRNILFDALVIAAIEMVGFRGILAPTLLQMETEVQAKQARLAYKQLENMCLLPRDECLTTDRCAWINGDRCMALGSERVVEGATGKDAGKLEWHARAGTPAFRKTSEWPLKGADATAAQDEVAVYWSDTIQEVALRYKNTEEGRKEIAATVKKLQGVMALEHFINLLQQHAVRVGGMQTGKDILKRLAEKIRTRREAMETIKHTFYCGEAYEAVKVACELVEIMHGMKDAHERGAKLTDMVEKLTKLLTSKEKGLGLTQGQTAALLCSLIQALLVHYNEIYFFQCDMDKVACKKAEKHGVCRWDANKCYNPLLQQIDQGSSMAALFGLAETKFSEQVKRISQSNPLDLEGADKDMWEVLAAIYGRDFMLTVFATGDAEQALRKRMGLVAEVEGARKTKAEPLTVAEDLIALT